VQIDLQIDKCALTLMVQGGLAVFKASMCMVVTLLMSTLVSHVELI
jgi:hypothetical protein